MPINRFRGQYFYLSNFFPCRNGVEYEGAIYPTSEHAYQAAKIEERDGRDSFTIGGSVGENPMEAKRKGGKVKMRPGWDSMRVKVMEVIVRSKFARDLDLQAKLAATGNQTIVEGHTGDKFWGGKVNHLGNILMKVRRDLKIDCPPPADPDSTAASDTDAPAAPVIEKGKKTLEVTVVAFDDIIGLYWPDRSATFRTILQQVYTEEGMILTVKNPATQEEHVVDPTWPLLDYAESMRVEIIMRHA